MKKRELQVILFHTEQIISQNVRQTFFNQKVNRILSQNPNKMKTPCSAICGPAVEVLRLMIDAGTAVAGCMILYSYIFLKRNWSLWKRKTYNNIAFKSLQKSGLACKVHLWLLFLAKMFLHVYVNLATLVMFLLRLQLLSDVL